MQRRLFRRLSPRELLESKMPGLPTKMCHAAGEREFFIDNLLVRIHFIIVMIRWTGLAPWEFTQQEILMESCAPEVSHSSLLFHAMPEGT